MAPSEAWVNTASNIPISSLQTGRHEHSANLRSLVKKQPSHEETKAEPSASLLHIARVCERRCAANGLKQCFNVCQNNANTARCVTVHLLGVHLIQMLVTFLYKQTHSSSWECIS